MSTTAHVVVAAGRLRVAWGWLATTATPSTARRNQRTLSRSAMVKRNERAVEERADRPHLTNAGRIVGGGRAPTNLAAVEARTRIVSLVEDAAGEITLRISTTGNAGSGYRPVGITTNERFTGALNWVSVNAKRVTDQPILDNAHRLLTEADRIARTVVGDGPDRQRFAASCPACGRRNLYWDTSSPDDSEHHVGCSNPRCSCRGRDCACKASDRQHGMRHLWLAPDWNALAQRLKETE